MLSMLCFLVILWISALGTINAGLTSSKIRTGYQETDDVTLTKSISQIKCNEYRRKQDVCMPLNGTSDLIQGEMPHMVMISSAYLPFREDRMDRVCGGALISENFVLTSGICAHIVQLIMEKGIAYIRLGEVLKNFLNDGDETDNTTQTIKVAKTYLHPKFNKEEKSPYSIGLIQLAKPARLNDFVRPACLQNTQNYLGSNTLIVSDWNRDEDNTHSLRASLSELVPPEDSQLKPSSDKHNSLCAKTSIGVRAGDDGGTVLQTLSPPPYCDYHIVGISGLVHCGTAKDHHKLSYVQIAHNIPWIEKVVWPKLRASKLKPT